MKRISTVTKLVTILFLGLLFSTCSSSEDHSSDSATEDVTGVTDTEIVIGSWGPLTGPAALWGSIVKGTDAYFKMINDEGGIHGRKIKFVFKDDAYDPSRTVPAVRELVQKDEIFAVAGGIGTAPCMSVMGYLEENNVPWISPITGATHWTFPTRKNIFTSFPLYFDEGEIMASYAIEKLNSKKVGIIYQNDDFGKSGLVGAKNYLMGKDMDFVAALPVEITDTDLSSHIAKLKDSGAESVFLWVLPRQAAIILGSSAVIDFKPNWMASIVLSDMSLMHNITKGAWEGVYFNYPGNVLLDDPNASPLIIKYKEAYAKYYPEERWGTFPGAGFTWIEPFVEGLRKAGKDLTRESFLEAMATIKDFDTSIGIPVSFSKEKHLGTRSLSIMRCVSATEAESVGDIITNNSDVSAMIEMLHGS
jgi:ABC-type branched-subunit amino acid transport system substrate-binding protein